MSKVSKSALLGALLLASCAASSTHHTAPGCCESADLSASEELSALLASRDFRELPYERMASGHALVHVSINGSTPRRFVCDTGSGATLIFPSLAAELGLNPESSGHRAGGIGGEGMEMSSVAIDSLTIQGVEFNDELISVLDLSHLNQQFEAVGEMPIEGIIGAPWMAKHEVVLNTPANTMFARP